MVQRLTTTERGYGYQHTLLRAEWKPLVDAGTVQCHAIHCLKRTRWITPGTPWDLGHTADRTAYTGPEHQTCNRADGARRGNRLRGHRHHRTQPATTTWHSRAW